MEQITQTTFPNGLNVYRHYDSAQSSNVDTQCGDLTLWLSYCNQLAHDSFEYYNQIDGTNKFFRCVNIHVYSTSLPFPNAQTALALTYSRGTTGQLPAYHSDITIQYFDPKVNAYRFPAALSHEMGHAFHNWVGLYGADNTGEQEVDICWERMISINQKQYTGNETHLPWTLDKPWEQFANTFRCIFGTYLDPGHTRGSSGPGTPDPVIAGFNDPKAEASWKKAIQLLPETCAMIKNYGVASGTMAWKDAYWYFQTKQGVWVYQDDYYSWYQWAWNLSKFSWEWQKFSPTYNRV